MAKINIFSSKIKAGIKGVIPRRILLAVRLFIDAWRGRFAFGEDCLYTYVHADFTHDPRFVRAYGFGRALMMPSWGDYQFRWRAYVACWAAEQASRLEGDFAECGVNTGMLARMIIDYVDFPSLSKTFYLLDTFEGMAPAYSTAQEMERSKHMGYVPVFEQVQQTFAPYNTVLIKGPVPDTLSQVTAHKICFLSVDMNTALPEQKALEFFWDKLVSGGIVLLDDYGFPGHEAQKQVHERFAASRGVSVLALPTGQGIIFKP